MCGVVGFSCENPKDFHFKILYDIIYESKIRGIHSFGFTYLDNNKLVTKKYHNIDDVVFPKTKKIIYHNRYSTSGDFQNHLNNQPLHNDKLSLVFNGVLDMRTKDEMEKAYNIKMQTYNDGEIIIHKCGDNKIKLENYIKTIKGSFAGLVLTSENKLWAIRNINRPLWKLNYKGATYFASTKNIFKRVKTSFEPEELIPNKIYEN